MNAVSTILSLNNIEVIYNHVILVLKGVSLDVPAGGIVALLGANGAGKTTTLKAISNLLQGRARRRHQGLHRVRGQARRPVDPQRTGPPRLHPGDGRPPLLRPSHDRREPAHRRLHPQGRPPGHRRDLELVYRYFPRLKERRASLAGYTSGGEQQMCAIGRALMSRPTMILLDEPSMGLAPQLVEEIFEIVKRLNEDEGVSFLLAEQNTNMALRFANYGYILENGRVVLDGEAAALRDNEDVKEFYLGVTGPERKSFRNVKAYKRRKRWLA